MVQPSLFPLFMNPLGGATTAGGEVIVALMADPDIILDPDIQVILNTDEVVISLDEEIEIEVE